MASIAGSINIFCRKMRCHLVVSIINVNIIQAYRITVKSRDPKSRDPNGMKVQIRSALRLRREACWNIYGSRERNM